MVEVIMLYNWDFPSIVILKWNIMWYVSAGYIWPKNRAPIIGKVSKILLFYKHLIYYYDQKWIDRWDFFFMLNKEIFFFF